MKFEEELYGRYKLNGGWRVEITHSSWFWSGPYGWMWCGPWRPWTRLLEWYYNTFATK